MAFSYQGRNWDSPKTAYDALYSGVKGMDYDSWYNSVMNPAPAPLSMGQLADQKRPAYEPGYDQTSMSALGYNYTPSRWLGMSKFKNDLEEQDQREKALRQTRGAASAAEDALAAKGGGLSSGARERIQQGAMKNYLGMSQDIQRQGNINDLNMNISDMQSQRQAQTQDTQNQIAEIGRMNAYNQNVYKQQMEAEAAERQANAEAASAREAARARKRGISGAFK